METKSEKAARELGNEFCQKAYKILEELFQDNPGMKMVFSHEVGYRKITEIAPFGTCQLHRKTPDGKWEAYDTEEGAGYLMCKEHYIHGERWCSKALDTWFGCTDFWANMLHIIQHNDICKTLKVKEPEEYGNRVTFDWVPNDMGSEHWTIGC